MPAAVGRVKDARTSPPLSNTTSTSLWCDRDFHVSVVPLTSGRHVALLTDSRLRGIDGLVDAVASTPLEHESANRTSV